MAHLNVKEVLAFSCIENTFVVVISAAGVLREAILQEAVQTPACSLGVESLFEFVLRGAAVLAVEPVSRDQTADAAHDGSGGKGGERGDRVIMSVQSEDVLIKAVGG